MLEVRTDAVAVATRAPRRRRRSAAPSCDDCFFRRRMLCALDLDAPCSTFRAEGPSGLIPPRQPSLLVRQPAEHESQTA